MSLSPYVFSIRDNSKVHLYNSANGAIVSFNEEYFTDDGIFIESKLTDFEKEYLTENLFFIDYEDGLRIINNSLSNNPHRLTISVEITHKCNFSCSYCYQKGDNERCEQTYENIDLLLEYINKVYKYKKFTELVLVVLGGEPALEQKKFKYIVEKIKDFCDSNNVYWYMGVDTNGYEIEYLADLFVSNEMYLTIPLTYKEHHNIERKTRSGTPTYDLIIENINRLYAQNPKIGITIRHNTCSENIDYFEEFIKDLSEKLVFAPRVTLNYTLETPGVEYTSCLTYEKFVHWCSTTAIDILVKYNFPVILSPNMYYSDCQTKQEYSIKLFNDGHVGACAMYFNHHSNPRINELLDNFELLKHCWDGIKDKCVTNNTKCQKCRKIFLCNGGELPCYYKNGISPCNGPDGVILELNEYIIRYVKYKKDKPELFANFDKQEIFR